MMITLARRVALTVSIDGHDVSGPFAPFLLDFSYTDNSGGKADDLQLTLQNNDGRFTGDWMPKKGMEIIASAVCQDWQRDGEDLALNCGSFTIDEVELSGPPDKVAIKAVSASLSGGLRDTRRTRAWENTGLKMVAEQIAKENDLEPVYIGEDCRFQRQDQRNESDIAFLNRLAKDFGFSCKAHNGKLALFDLEMAGQEDGRVVIYKSGGMYSPTSYNFKMSASGTDYDNAEIAYTDPKTGKTQKATANNKKAKENKGGNKKTLTINQRVEDPDQALKMSRAKLNEENEKERTASLEIMGCPLVFAGANITLEGFGQFDGKWRVKTATHKMDSGGYKTSLEISDIPESEGGETQSYAVKEQK